MRWFRLKAFGFRRIVADYQIRQIERLPALGVRSALNSMLLESGDPERPTLMVDEVVMEVPRLLAPLKGYILRSLARHAATQCAEDEPFRARRWELRQRGIGLPFRIFGVAVEETLMQHFREALQPVPAPAAIDGQATH